jgi:hypothetical protein
VYEEEEEMIRANSASPDFEISRAQSLSINKVNYRIPIKKVENLPRSVEISVRVRRRRRRMIRTNDSSPYF